MLYTPTAHNEVVENIKISANKAKKLTQKQETAVREKFGVHTQRQSQNAQGYLTQLFQLSKLSKKNLQPRSTGMQSMTRSFTEF